MYRISKRFEFSASHVLTGLPDGHQCGRLHGHNYTVELELESETLVMPGFVKDYGELAPFKTWLDSSFDHQHLNDRVDFNPTAELLAKYCHQIAMSMFGSITQEQTLRVSAVRVYETPKTCAEYRP